MDKRRVITSAVVVATVGAATALTYPAIAGTERSKPGSGSTAAAPAVSADMLAALQRDLRMTRPQAQARLAKDAWARKTTSSLRARMGDAWAGAWMNADGTQLNVAVTDRAQAAAIQRAGAVPKLVARNATQLNTVKQALDRQAGKAASSIPGWYVDPASNSVVVLTSTGRLAAVRSFVAAAGVPASTVRVVASAETPKLLTPGPDQAGEQEQANAGAQRVVGGTAYIIENQARCSVGFAVVGGFISAGHCGQEGDEAADPAGNQLAEQGAFEASSFPGDDFSFVALNEDFVGVAEVDSFDGETVPNGGGEDGLAPSNETLPVAGSEEAPVGATVCKFGSTTGASCGVIQALNASAQVADPIDGVGQVTINGVIRTDVCAEGGDSGGPLLAGDQAQGVVSAGAGDCAAGGVTFFQPVNEILQRLDKTLLVVGGQNGAGQNGQDADQQDADQQDADEDAAQDAEQGGDEGGMTGGHRQPVQRTGHGQR